MKRFAFVATAMVAVVATATALGQSLHDGRLYCGDRSFDFDQVMPATESIFDLRRRDLDRLRDVVASAQAACAPDTCKPWCRGYHAALTRWRNVHDQTCPSAGDCVALHRQRVDAERALLHNAQRAAAHRICVGVRGAPDLRCDELIDAEMADAPRVAAEMSRVAAAPIVVPSRTTTPQQAIQMSLVQRGWLIELQHPAVRAFFLGRALNQMTGDAGAPPGGDGGTETQDDAVAAAEEFARCGLGADLPSLLEAGGSLLHRHFYRFAYAASEDASAATTAAAREVLARESAPASSASEEGQSITAAITRLEGERARCRSADIYVLPNGDVRINAPFQPQDEGARADASRPQSPSPPPAPWSPRTLCIDVSEFQYEEALEVGFSTSSEGPSQPQGSAPPDAPRTDTVLVWPGDRVSIRLPDVRGPVVRMTVRGLPRGRSLRVLAARGADAQLAPNVRDIDALLQLQQEVDADAGTLRAARDTRRVVALMASLATHLNYSNRVTGELAAMRRAANALPASPAPGDLASAKAAIAQSVEGIRSEADRWVMNDHSPAANLAVANLEAKLQDVIGAATRADVVGAVTALAAWRTAPSGAQVPSTLGPMEEKERTLQRALAWVCRVARTQHRAVVHDLLLPLGDRAFDVVDYDVEQGYVGSHHLNPSPRWCETGPRPFLEDVPIYVRVSRVAGNQNVFVLVSGRPVATASNRVIGAGDAGVPADASVTTRGGSVEEQIPATAGEASYQLPGTRVVLVGTLEPGMRHATTVCLASNASLPPAPSGSVPANTPCGAGTVVGNNDVEVHGYFRLGVLAGLGASLDFSGATPYPVRNSPDSNTWVVAERRPHAQFSVPLLLTWYPWGRDPLSSRFAFGIGAGLEITAPLDRFYPLALTFAAGPVGLTLGAVVHFPTDSAAPARVAAGTAIAQPGTASSPPDLAAIFGRDNAPTVGGFAAATFDLDLFRRAFNTLFKDKLPTIP